MTTLYINNSDPYNSTSKDEHILLKPKQYTNGKSPSVQFADNLVLNEKNNDVVDVGGDTSGEETGGGETTETESKHSDEDDYHEDPPDDYLERIEVRKIRSSLH